MNSGIYIRVGSENELLECLEKEELLKFINGLNEDGLKRTIIRLCEVLYDIQMEFNLLDGVYDDEEDKE